MSVEVMSWVFSHSQSKGAARLVLLAMADEAAATGELSAYRRSQSWIARKANVSVRSVRDCIDSLVSLGELEVLREGLGLDQANYLIRMGEEQISARVRNRFPLREEQISSPSSRSSPVEPIPLVAQPCDVLFERFWKSYPRRQGTSKKTARSAFKSALKRGHEDMIRQGLKRDMAMWLAERRLPEHIPHASTWLNQERYMPEDNEVESEHPDTGKVVWLPGDQPARINPDGSYTPITVEEAERD